MLYRDPFEGAQQPEVVIGTGCVDHQEVAVAVVGEHEVVQYPAVLVGEQPVTLASLLQPGDAGRDQRLEGSGGISQVPGLWVDQNLTHVADVEQRGGFPCVLVFRDDSGELHGQLPPGEIHQTTTQFLVQPVQRGG